MPKLSQQVWDDRRHRVLESAWRCFARRGFHATSMDDVIAETGWSPSVVYRYIRSKDELIEAAGAEAFRELKSFADDMVTRRPVPGPVEVVRAFADLMDDAAHQRSYNLAGLVVHSWAEAFDDASIAARGGESWAQVSGQFAVLARAWQDEGGRGAELAISDVAAVMTLIAPAIVIDQAFLDGRGTAGLQRILAVRDPA